MRFGRQTFFGIILWCAAQPAPGETLPDAVARAVSRFPDLRASAASRRAAEQLTAQARGALLPSIDASLGQGRETSRNLSTRGAGSDSVSLTRREAEVAVTQLLFDGGVATGQVRRFDARSDSAALQVAAAAEALALRVTLAYLDVLRLRGQVELAGQNVAKHRETLRQVELLADGGAGRRSDVYQAVARLALAQSSLTQLEGQLEQARAELRHLAGPPAGELIAPASLEQSVPAALPALLESALAAHPSVRAAERDLAAAHADRDSARARFAPRVNLEIGLSHNRDLDGVPGPNADRFAMLRLRQNLFRGGADDARIREAEARIDEALANVGRARNDLERDLRQAWETLRADRSRMPQLAMHAGMSVQVVEAYRQQFRIGQRTLLDVLNAENEQFSARSNVLAGLYAVSAGEARVLAGAGKLLETLGVPLPEEAKPREAQR
jgi:adhesin transport system outer membrane protein